MAAMEIYGLIGGDADKSLGLKKIQLIKLTLLELMIKNNYCHVICVIFLEMKEVMKAK
jgi:hypothetical protein